MSLIVLKVGGASTSGAIATVSELRGLGHRVCVVHGAGPQISEEMERRSLDVQFVGGLRVTTPEGLEIVRDSLRTVNAALCGSIGPDAVGLAGDEIGLEAVHLPELGLVGRPVPTRPAAVEHALAAGRVPVVSPLARGPLNVNADEAAVALAIGLRAHRVLFVTDVPGVFYEGRLLHSIPAARAVELVDQGGFEGGIVPKLLAAARAARSGLVADIGSTRVVA